MTQTNEECKLGKGNHFVNNIWQSLHNIVNRLSLLDYMDLKADIHDVQKAIIKYNKMTNNNEALKDAEYKLTQIDTVLYQGCKSEIREVVKLLRQSLQSHDGAEFGCNRCRGYGIYIGNTVYDCRECCKTARREKIKSEIRRLLNIDINKEQTDTVQPVDVEELAEFSISTPVGMFASGYALKEYLTTNNYKIVKI